MKNIFNLLLASGKFCCMLMKFSNSWDPDQARCSVRPDLDPSYLTLIFFLKEDIEKSNVEEYPQKTKNSTHYAKSKKSLKIFKDRQAPSAVAHLVDCGTKGF